ncbi:ATP-dependent nuclease [Pseudoalteromonas lipolytica]|uniref:ATP-dependent nuclease n=1 Tax=Pseudoalteromonas lipolytica TaxID=570156 RepID=UPI000C66C759|nr:AAA family ATPase [Pseudoalteromonas lipolytica]MAE01059.1 ATP-dependent endonuclease [Pseudoalteromonas sp.]|tara:strand:+ start:304 stop:2184 length:1881 start_codon:yes stop_codon:yes gene_type:complete
MYLHRLKMENFRRYEQLDVEFNSGLNLLVGENDSGKTAIVDAIKYVLNTQSYEYLRPCVEDFYLDQSKDDSHRASVFRVECTFKGFDKHSAKHFIDWLGTDKEKNFFLKVWISATRKNGRVFYDVKAGSDEEGTTINGEARDLLRATYLKPLRDAESELTPKKGSRLSQILYNHDVFEDEENHRLLRIMSLTNKAIEKFFTAHDGKELLLDINTYLDEFSLESNKLNSRFNVSDSSLKSVLEKLSLRLFNQSVSESTNQGLGSHNLLYIAAELLLLKKSNYQGLKLGLIEEIEAHLHPQTQIRLIEAIQKICEENRIQFILTTHSTSLASKVKLKNLVLCKDGCLYPMGKEYTKLREGDYLFLERFLDSTKSNLFFANGVILVEGDAENILLPSFAKKIGRDLSQHSVSIVNVGSTAFLRYSNIFLRQDEKKLILDVSLITDVDVRPFIHENKQTKNKKDSNENVLKDEDGKTIKVEMTEVEVEEVRINTAQGIRDKYEAPVTAFVAPYWTLEYSIARSCLSELFHQAVYICHKTKSKDYVYGKEEKVTLIEKAKVEYKKWKDEDNLSVDEIAYNIYKKIMLDKKISKAVVAQVFADFIIDADFEGVEADENLSYLVSAIKNVTGK